MERFIGFNDSQENTNIIKKAIKILSLEIDKYFKANKQKLEFRNSSKEKDEKWVENFATIPASVYYDISNNDILIQCYKNPFRSNYTKRFHNNVDIIKKMLFEENKSINYVAKWIRIAYPIFLRLIRKYLIWESNNKIKIEQKILQEAERINNIRFLIRMYMASYRGRWINTKMITEFIQKSNIEDNSKPFKNTEIRKWMIEFMNYAWRKANVRPPRSLRAGLEDDRLIFSNFVKMLIQAKFIIVYIDECSFNSSSLPLYTWMKKGEPPVKVIQDTSKRYNSIAAKWEDKVYFMIKSDTSKEDDVWLFINLLMKQLEMTIQKNQLSKRTVIFMDNAKIHKTLKEIELIKKLKLIVFSIPPYSPELNKVEHVFGSLKKYISFRNLNAKEFKQVIIEEIQKI